RDGGNRVCEPRRHRFGTNTGNLSAGHSLCQHSGQRRHEQQRHCEYPYVTEYALDSQHRRCRQLHGNIGLFAGTWECHARQSWHQQWNHIGRCGIRFGASRSFRRFGQQHGHQPGHRPGVFDGQPRCIEHGGIAKSFNRLQLNAAQASRQFRSLALCRRAKMTRVGFACRTLAGLTHTRSREDVSSKLLQPPRGRSLPMASETILLRGADVEALLSPELCIEAVEDAFRRLARQEVPPPAILGVRAQEGSFHVKAGLLEADSAYFAAKVNANFPQNMVRFGLPTIQGAVLLFGAPDGRLLAVMDSMSLTARRTAAATALAARYLSRVSSKSLLLCGCRAQALEQLRAVLCVRNLDRIRAFDLDAMKATAFAAASRASLGVDVAPVHDLH